MSTELLPDVILEIDANPMTYRGGGILRLNFQKISGDDTSDPRCGRVDPSLTHPITALPSLSVSLFRPGDARAHIYRYSAPVLVAQWVKPLLIGHSACRPDGLRAVSDLGSNPGQEGSFFSA